MSPIQSMIPSVLGRMVLLFSALWLAACEPIQTVSGGPTINSQDAVPVALLVPGSSAGGGEAALSQSLENAARMAIADLNGADIDLRVYQTGGSSAQAASIATRAVDEGAKIIIGPVFAEAAASAGVAVANRGINVLSFSNNPAVAGGNVFILGNTFDNTANRLVRFAAGRGKGNIMIVHARDTAEGTGRAAIARAIASSGATLAGTESFELSQNGVVQAVPQIASQAKAAGADSIFLTSGSAGALPFLAQLLPENGIDPASTQYIGLQRWDIPSSALSLPGLQGGWFALPDPNLSQQFQSRYSATYGSAPHPLAGLAYDSIAAIGALVSDGRSNALTRGALTQGSGFAGVNGVFRLLPNGTNERGLAIAEIRNNQVTVIDPAPRSFGGAGF